MMWMEKNLLVRKQSKKLLKIFSKIILMPNGTIHIISSRATGRFPNGHLQEQNPMAARWRSLVVIFSLFVMGKFISKILTGKTVRQFPDQINFPQSGLSKLKKVFDYYSNSV